MKIMKLKYLLLALIVSFCTVSCLDNGKATKNSEEKSPSEEITEESDFKYWTWITADANRPDSSYTAEFKKYKNYGLDAVLINTDTDPQLLTRLTPLAIDQGLEVHAWIMALNRPGDSVALQHPDWYAVSREGNSTFDTRPYVD